MVKVINFSIISGDNTKSIAYSFNIVDANGNIQKANIRRSLPFTSDTVLTAAINTANIMDIYNAICSYIVENTTI